MNSALAKSKYIKISPRKARLAADLIRGLPVAEATAQLQHCGMKAGILLAKTLNSAVANAESQQDARAEELLVKEVRIDEGPRAKRAWARSRGGRSMILRRTSHFTVTVGTK